MINRRNLLKTLIATTVASATPAIGFASGKRFPWKNWSGNLQCFPEQRLAPGSIEEIQEIVRSTQGRIRTVGSGHSFSPLVPTDETLLSISRLAGIKQVDNNTHATLYGGTRLSEIGPALNEHNQALINMPDIDQQTLAGATATSTHGTGQNFGSLSSYVTAMEIVTAEGDLITCSEDHNTEIFKAAQVSLGTLGIVTSLTMRNQSPFKLERVARWMSFEEITQQAHDLAKDNRNFEFFYFPFTGMALTDSLNVTDAPVTQNEELDGNGGLLDLKHARDYLSWSTKLRELILSSYMKTIEPSVNVDHSYAIYANDRNVRFNEMEYHMPAENGLRALTEVREVIESQFPEVFFPLEIRFIKADDIWLSPFYQQDTISIAIHRYFEEDYQAFFKALEPILQRHGGRPHWGKLNTMSAADFSQRYPKWQEFKAVRAAMDPKGKFLNKYLRQVFEV